jgi:hypothetical protein
MDADKIKDLEKRLAKINVKLKAVAITKMPAPKPKCAHCGSRKLMVGANIEELGFWWVEFTAILTCRDCGQVTVLSYKENMNNDK